MRSQPFAIIGDAQFKKLNIQDKYAQLAQSRFIDVILRIQSGNIVGLYITLIDVAAFTYTFFILLGLSLQEHVIFYIYQYLKSMFNQTFENNSAANQINQCVSKMLYDLSQKTSDIPNSKEGYLQFRFSDIKYPANRANLKKLIESYQKISMNISNLNKNIQLKKVQDSVLINLINKKQKIPIFNLLNKSLKLPENVAVIISENLCSGNQSIESMKIIGQSLQPQNPTNKSIIAQVKNLIKHRQGSIKQQKVHYLFSQLGAYKLDQATNCVKQQISQTYRQPVLKFIEELRSVSGHIESFYTSFNKTYFKYRSQSQTITMHKDHSKALKEINQQMERRNTKLYGLIQQIQKLNFMPITNKPKAVNNTIKIGDRIQNILGMLKGINDQGEKLRKIKLSYQSLVLLHNQYKNSLKKITQKNPKKTIIDTSSNLQDTLKQYQSDIKATFDKALEKQEQVKQLNSKVNDNFKGIKAIPVAQYTDYRNRVGQLERQIDSLLALMNKKEDEIKQKVDTIKNLNEAKFKLQIKERDLQTELYRCRNENETKLGQLSQIIVSTKKEKYNTDTKLQNQRRGYQIKMKQAETNLRKVPQQTELQQLRSKILQLQNLACSKDAQLIAYKKQTQTAFDTNNQQIKDLKYTMEALKKKNGQFLRVQANLKQQISQLETQIKSKNNQSAIIISQNLQNMKLKEVEISNIQREFSQLQAKYNQLNEYKQILQVDTQKLKQQLDQTNQNQQVNQSWISKLNKQIAAFKQKLQQSYKIQKISQTLLSEKETDLSNLAQQIRRNSHSLIQKQTLNVELLSINEKYNKTISQLQQNMIETTQNYNQLKELNAQLSAQNQSINRQMSSQKAQYEFKLDKNQQVISQLTEKSKQIASMVKLPNNLLTYYQLEAQKHINQQLNPINLMLVDRFLQGQLLREQVLHKHTIITALQKFQNKPITRTKLIYKYDPKSTVSFHSYIDGTRHMLLVVKSTKGVYLAGYNSGEYNERIAITEPGLLISLKTGETFELYSSSANRRYPCRAMTYDRFYLNFGNSQIRMKWTDIKKPELFSNFGVSNSYYNNRDFKVDALLGQGQVRDTTFEDFEIYEILFENSRMNTQLSRLQRYQYKQQTQPCRLQNQCSQTSQLGTEPTVYSSKIQSRYESTQISERDSLFQNNSTYTKELKLTIQEKQKEIKALKSQLTTLKLQTEDIRNQQTTQEITHYQSKEENLLKKISQLQEQLATQHQQYSRKNSQSETQVEAMLERQNQYKSQIDSLKKQIQTLEADLAKKQEQFQRQKQTLQAELDHVVSQRQKVESDLQRKNGQLIESKSQIQRLRGQLKRTNQQSAYNQQHQNSKLNQTILSLQTDKQNKEKEINDLIAKQDELKSRVEELTHQLDVQKSQSQLRLEEKVTQNRALKEEKESLQGRLQQMQGQIRNKQSQLIRLQEVTAELQFKKQQLCEVKNELSKVAADRSIIEQDLSKVDKQLAQLKTSYSNLQSNFAEAGQKHNTIIQNMQKQTDDVLIKFKKLKNQKQVLQKQLNELKEQAKGFKRTQNKVQLLEAQLTASKAQLENSSEQIRQNNQSISTKQEEISRLNQQNDELYNKNQENSKQLTKLRKDLDQAKAELQNINQKLAEMLSQLDEATQQNKKLLNANQENSIQLAELHKESHQAKAETLKTKQKLAQILSQLSEVTQEKNRYCDLYYTQAERIEINQKEMFELTKKYAQEMQRQKEIVQQLKAKCKSTGANLVISKHLHSQCQLEVQKLQKKVEGATLLDLFALDRFLQGELLRDQILHKHTIITALQKFQSKPITRTKLIYKYDPKTIDPKSTVSFHNYINGTRHMLLVVKSTKGVYLAGYNSGEYNEGIAITEPGLLISLKTGETFELYSASVNRKYACRAMTYDRFYLNFGNSQIRMKWTDVKKPELFSNFGVSNSYYNNRDFKVDALLGQGQVRETTFEDFQIYEIEYQKQPSFVHRSSIR